MSERRFVLAYSAFRGGGIDDRLHFRDAIGRKAALRRVLAYGLLVGCDVNTIDLVVGHVAMQPLNLRTQLLKHPARCLGDSLQLLRRQLSCAWDFSFDYVLWHSLSFR